MKNNVLRGSFGMNRVISAETVPLLMSEYLLLDKKPDVLYDGCVMYYIGGNMFGISGITYGDEEWHYKELTTEFVDVIEDSIINNYAVSSFFDRIIKESEGVLSIKKSYQKTYLMMDSNTGYIKIGKSFKPEQREKTLQSEKPTISLFAICEEDIEQDLHNKYINNRIRGEWFILTKEDVLEIIDIHNFKIIS